MSSPEGLYQNDFIDELQQGLMSIQQVWGLGDQTRWSLLCVSENATFKAEDPARDNPLAVRVHRPGYHSHEEIISELNWIQALDDDQIVTVPRPVETRDNELMTHFVHQGEPRDVVAFEFMPGIEPDEYADHQESFRVLGEITAKLHRHAQNWSLPAGFSRKAWNFETTLGDIAYWGDWRQALGLDADGQRLLQQCSDQLQHRLQQMGQGSECFGLIHADLHPANLLVDGSKMTVIDFDDCGFGWYLYDCAAAINEVGISPEISRLQNAWVEGYRRISPLSQDEIDCLPTLIMLRRQLVTAWVASHFETPSAQQLGAGYTRGTLRMASDYLKRFG